MSVSSHRNVWMHVIQFFSALILSVHWYFINKSLLQVNSNGHITFLGPVSTFVPQQLPLANDLQLIAPFWADSDTRNPESGLVWYRITSDRDVLDRAKEDIRRGFRNQESFEPLWLLIATWDHVGVYPRLADRVSVDWICFAVQTFILQHSN